MVLYLINTPLLLDCMLLLTLSIELLLYHLIGRYSFQPNLKNSPEAYLMIARVQHNA